MSNRLIDLDGDTIWVSFKYDATVVATVKSIVGRQFDGETKRWSLPVEKLDEVVQKLEPLHFSFTPRLRERWLDTRDDAPLLDQEPIPDPALDGAYSVSRLNEEVRRLLATNFTERLLLEGEISGWERNRPVGHAYFELVERVSKGTDPIARISAVCFGATRQKIAGKLNRAGVRLRDAQRVRFFVKPDLYPQGGKFQVIIEDVDAEFIVDQALKRRDVVVAELKRLGILTQNLDLPMPECPLRIGLVTAIDSDGYNDFAHELEASGYAFDVTLASAKMQGLDAGESVARAVAHLDRRELDVIVIVRGGGAKLSLADLDTIEVGQAVCNAKTKVICGIGHHRDQGVLDVIASSEKTPTAAAQFLVRRLMACEETLRDLGSRITGATDRALREQTRAVERFAEKLSRSSDRHLSVARSTLRARESRLSQSSKRVFDAATRDLVAITRSIQKSTSVAMRQEQIALQESKNRLVRVRFDSRFLAMNEEVERTRQRLERVAFKRLQHETSALDHRAEMLQVYSPKRTVERGFAIVRTADDSIVKGVDKLRLGDTLRIELRDGIVRVSVQTIDTIEE